MHGNQHFAAIAVLLCAALTGCGNAGNAVNTGNAINTGNAAGFIGNGVGNGQAWNRSPDTRDSILRGHTDDVRTHSIVYDASQRTVNIRIGAGPTPATNNGFYPNRPPSGGLRENVGRVVIPRGWTVNVLTDQNCTLSVVPYPVTGIGTDVFTGAGGNRLTANSPNQGVTRPSPHPGTSFVARDPGDYAIVQLNRGRPNQLVEVITVTASTRMPSITTVQPFRSR